MDMLHASFIKPVTQKPCAPQPGEFPGPDDYVRLRSGAVAEPDCYRPTLRVIPYTPGSLVIAPVS